MNVQIKHSNLQMEEIWTQIFKNSNMFSMLSTLTNMSIEHTHDWRLHQLLQIFKCKDEIWWSLQIRNIVFFLFKLNTFKFQSVVNEIKIAIKMAASLIINFIMAEMLYLHYELKFVKICLQLKNWKSCFVDWR